MDKLDFFTMDRPWILRFREKVGDDFETYCFENKKDRDETLIALIKDGVTDDNIESLDLKEIIKK